MKKLSKDNNKKFINYKNPTDESVFVFFFINLLACFIIIGLSYNRLRSFLIFLPFVILTLAIYFIFKKKKNPQTKMINLFCGLKNILLSLICQCGCFMFVPLSTSDKIYLAILLAILNIVVVGLIALFSANLVRTKKFPGDKPVSIAVISISVFFGIRLSRQIDSIINMMIVFAGFSCIASAFSTIYIIKYKKTEDGSLS